LILPTIYIPK